MEVRKFTSDDLRTMSLFNSICGNNPLDCFEAEGTLIFITKPGQTAMAIGKDGVNIKNLKSALNRNVKVIEDSDSLEKLIGNFLYPIKTKSVKKEDDVILIEFSSGRERRVVLNNNQSELKKLKFVIARYHKGIRDVRIL